MSTSVSREEANIVTRIKTPEDHAISGSFETLEYSSSSSYKGSVKTKSFFNKRFPNFHCSHIFFR
ncbi:hypothetical protein DITRI_Ditri01bG0166800 [Diplodiscus trichospermus]